MLGEFRRRCGERGVPAALANLEECHSPWEILTSLRQSCEPRSSNRAFREFDSLISRLNQINQRLRREDESTGRVSEATGRILGGVSAAAVGSLVTSLALGPVGLLLGAAGGALTKEVLESLTSALIAKGLLSREDAGFLNNLLPRLTASYLSGSEKLGSDANTVVLILDGYEYAQHVETLEGWITGHLLPNVRDVHLVVIAGRNQPEGRFWQKYSSVTYQRRLEPFTYAHLAQYFARRGLQSDQTRSLYRLTAGLPLGAALWADMEAQRQSGLPSIETDQRLTDVIRGVVERLLEKSDPTLREFITVCAIPRQIDQDILRDLFPAPQTQAGLYAQLQRFSSLFQSRSAGLAMHSEVRGYLIRDWRQRDLARFQLINTAMASYHQRKTSEVPKYTDKWFRHYAEYAYHMLTAVDRVGLSSVLRLLAEGVEMYNPTLVEAIGSVVTDTSLDMDQSWHVLVSGLTAFSQEAYHQCYALLSPLLDVKWDRVVRAHVLLHLSTSGWRIDRYEEAIRHGEAALELFAAMGDKRGQSEVCENLGWVHAHIGNYQEAVRYEERGLSLATEIDDELGKGWALNSLGAAYYHVGNMTLSKTTLEKALQIWERLDHRAGQFYSTYHLGIAHFALDQFHDAIALYERSLSSLPQFGDRHIVLARMGQAKASQGTYEEALQLFAQARLICVDRQQPYFEAILEWFEGDAAALQKQWEHAIEHYHRAVTLSHGVRARYVEAKARVGLLRVAYSQEEPDATVAAAAAAAMQLGKDHHFHNVLAETYLFRGLAIARETTQHRGAATESGYLACADSFGQSLIEGLQYNSHIVDKTLGDIATGLKAYGPAITSAIAESLLRIWQSSTCCDETVVEVERKLRQRDALTGSHSSVVLQLREWIINGESQ